MQDLLTRAAKRFEEARGLPNKAIVTRRGVLRWRPLVQPPRDSGKKAILALGYNYQSLAAYGEAADYFEAFTRSAKKNPEAPTALSNALLFRLALARSTRRSRREYLREELRRLRSLRWRPASRSQSRIASIEYEDPKEAKKRLTSSMSSSISEASSTHAPPRARPARARAGDAGRRQRRRGPSVVVRASWKDPATTVTRPSTPTASPPSPRQGAHRDRRGAVLLRRAAAGERGAQSTSPSTKGQGDGPTSRKFLPHGGSGVDGEEARCNRGSEEKGTPICRWSSFQPAPPPRRVIASAASVGQMWGSSRPGGPRSAESPRNGRSGVWRGEERQDLLRRAEGLLHRALDGATEPQKQRAKAAFKACLSYSTKRNSNTGDPYAQACERVAGEELFQIPSLDKRNRAAPDLAERRGARAPGARASPLTTRATTARSM